MTASPSPRHGEHSGVPAWAHFLNKTSFLHEMEEVRRPRLGLNPMRLAFSAPLSHKRLHFPWRRPKKAADISKRACLARRLLKTPLDQLCSL
jgi:hypothetical protein